MADVGTRPQRRPSGCGRRQKARGCACAPTPHNDADRRDYRAAPRMRSYDANSPTACRWRTAWRWQWAANGPAATRRERSPLPSTSRAPSGVGSLPVLVATIRSSSRQAEAERRRTQARDRRRAEDGRHRRHDTPTMRQPEPNPDTRAAQERHTSGAAARPEVWEKPPANGPPPPPLALTAPRPHLPTDRLGDGLRRATAHTLTRVRGAAADHLLPAKCPPSVCSPPWPPARYVTLLMGHTKITVAPPPRVAKFGRYRARCSAKFGRSRARFARSRVGPMLADAGPMLVPVLVEMR